MQSSALRKAREGKGLSQVQLARKSSVRQGMISQLEQGKTAPSLAAARRLAQALETSIDELFPDELVGAGR